MRVYDSEQLINLVSETKFVHILGAGLNSEKPANSAVKDLSERGWNPIPIHPKDAGASISGYPIRPMIEDGIGPEIVVLFLAPERAREAIRKLLIRNYESPPLIWFQLGAEDDLSEDWLQNAGWKFVKDDCIVRFAQRHDLVREPQVIPWFKQVQSDDDSGCSVWSVHEWQENSEKSKTKLEWIGDLKDLENSITSIPNYIRSLRNEGESLEECARRLAN
jgi:hypothetical protein